MKNLANFIMKRKIRKNDGNLFNKSIKISKKKQILIDCDGYLNYKQLLERN